MRVVSGNAERWTALRNVRIGSGGPRPGRRYEIEASRAYRDRLVLKLRDVDGPEAAARLRGGEVWAPQEELPALPPGEHYQARLIGARVVDEGGGELGRVRDVLETGGADVLVVEEARGGEVLVPLAGAMVLEIDESAGRIRVRLPEGLRELNRPPGGSGR